MFPQTLKCDPALYAVLFTKSDVDQLQASLEIKKARQLPGFEFENWIIKVSR